MIVPAKVVLTHVTRRVPWGGVLEIRGRLLNHRQRPTALPSRRHRPRNQPALLGTLKCLGNLDSVIAGGNQTGARFGP